ncbi:MAG TPA: erythromycin esterase family protein, partial [Candidatus Acidoferrales bacterium]|nr:erythromycin esterase family protein [Candidatus Acidoferrales bacterium]
YQYRLLMLRYLLARGWNRIGEELGVCDGHRIDQFFATGDAAHLDRAPIYGFKGDARTDRTDAPTGLLSDSYAANYPAKELAVEQKAFAKSLRQLANERVHFFGFDIDGSPGGGYADIAEMFEPYVDDAAISEIAARLARVADESVDAEAARLDAALNLIDVARQRLSDLTGAASASKIAHQARALRDSFRYIQMAFPAATWPALKTAMAFRETVMHRNVEDALAEAGPSGKIALMSHNLHLAKDYGRVKGSIGAGPGGGKVDAVGTHIAKLMPGEVYSVWMLCNRGRDCQPFSFCTCEIKPVAGSINPILASIASALVLPLDSLENAYFADAELLIQMDGNTGVRTPIARQADAIVFIDEVSPLKL